MMLPRKPAVRLSNLIGVRGLPYAERFVIVFFRCSMHVVFKRTGRLAPVVRDLIFQAHRAAGARCSRSYLSSAQGGWCPLCAILYCLAEAAALRRPPLVPTYSTKPITAFTHLLLTSYLRRQQTRRPPRCLSSRRQRYRYRLPHRHPPPRP